MAALTRCHRRIFRALRFNAVAGEIRTPQGPGTSQSNVLPYPDQALFLALRGAGQDSVIQIIWIYEHPVDLVALERFRDNWGSGWMARLIEPSPVPFGRHRWVSAPAPSAGLDVATHPRPRDELYDWADEQVQLPLDPQRGPAWRFAVQPLTDGSTAVSLLASHCIADGRAGIDSITDAVKGRVRKLDYPPPGSRTKARAIRSDLRQTLSDAGEIRRTVGKAVRVLTRRRAADGGSGERATRARRKSRRGSSGPSLTLPSVALSVDIAQWDARAAELGGNSLSLLAGFAGRLAQHLGRVRASDGAVTLMIPVSERADITVDTGGNVVSIARVSIDPEPLTTDLSGARSAIRMGLKSAREKPDEMIELLPLIPFVPKRAVTSMADMAFGLSEDLPVSCSNMGDVPAELRYVDGTAAEYLFIRGMDRDLSRELIERKRGVLTFISVRSEGAVIVTVIGYQPGRENSRTALRQLVAQTLEEFNLTATII